VKVGKLNILIIKSTVAINIGSEQVNKVEKKSKLKICFECRKQRLMSKLNKIRFKNNLTRASFMFEI